MAARGLEQNASNSNSATWDYLVALGELGRIFVDVRSHPCLIQITKALLLRNDSLSTQLVNCLFEVFDNEDIDWFAAKALGDICRSDMIFTKSNYAVIKVRLRQQTGFRQ